MDNNNKMIKEGKGKKFIYMGPKLPTELLQDIGTRLTNIIDYIRFRAVCLLLGSVLPDKPHHLPCQLPWLTFHHYNHLADDFICFFRLSDNRIHKLKLEFLKPHFVYCKGSSNGWLVIYYIRYEKFSLVNPFTKAQIQIPMTLSMPCYSLIFLDKLVLSANPSITNDYICFAICNGDQKLAFFRSGDEEWTQVKQPERELLRIIYHDIIYYKGKFYVVDSEGRLYICNVEEPSPSTIIESLSRVDGFGKKYLVESSGELLLVKKSKRFFNVYKFNQSERNWVPVKSLGDRMLFLGYTNSLSRSASDFPQFKPNHIYYINSSNAHDVKFNFNGAANAGVYNLEDNSIEPLPGYPNNSTLDIAAPTWITPSLC